MKPKHQKYNPDLQALAPHRIRQVRPEFWTDDRLCELPMSARLLFVGLGYVSDKNGRFAWRPKTLRARIFPFDVDYDFDSDLERLRAHGEVRHYTANGEEFGVISRWKTFQYISKTEFQADGVYPAPPEDSNPQRFTDSPENVSKRSETSPHLGVGVGLGVREGVGKSKRESEGVTSAAAAPAADEKALSPSHPAGLKAAQYETATPKPGIPELVDFIMERALSLCAGKVHQVQFTKTAKHDLAEELQKLGDVSKAELLAAVQTTYAACSDEVSYKIFGSSLASNLVASVHEIRRRNEAAEAGAQAAEIIAKQREWKDQCYAAARDLSIDLEDWLNAHPSPVVDAYCDEATPEAVCDKLEQDMRERRVTEATAREIREKAEAQQSAQPNSAPSAEDKPPQTDAPIPAVRAKRQMETTIIGQTGAHQGHALSSNNNGGSVRCHACNRFLSDAEAEIAWPMDLDSVAAD